MKCCDPKVPDAPSPADRYPLIGGSGRQPAWVGRFPKDVLLASDGSADCHDLGESTSGSLRLWELLDLVGGLESLRDLDLGYGAPAGAPALRVAAGETCGVAAHEVLTTQGAMLGLFLLAFELCRPGTEVLLVTPCFSPARDTLASCGAQLRTVRLRFEEDYHLDPGRLAAELRPETRLVSIASPQNPSGVQVPEDTIRAILGAMTARAPDAFLLVDETYREASYGRTAPPASTASIDPRIIVTGSLSKAYGVPGLRVGWLTVRDPALRERLTIAKAHLVLSGSVLDEALTAALLRRRDAVLVPRRSLLARNLAAVAAWVRREAHRLEWVSPHGGALCCVRLRPEIFNASAVDRFWASLPTHGLRLGQGSWFAEDARVFRLGFGRLPTAELALALAALSRAVAAASGTAQLGTPPTPGTQSAA